MSIKNREDIRDLINKIETSYPVSEWMHNGYHIWPVLRIRLFKTLVKQNENSRDLSSFLDNQSYSVFYKLIRALIAGYRCNSFRLNSHKKLYFAAPQFRTEYLGKNYNKYFDSCIDNEDILIEYYSVSKENYYNSKRVILLDDLWRYFRLFKKKYWLFTYEDEDSECAVKLNNIVKDFDIEVKNLLPTLKKHIHHVDRYYYTCYEILKKIKPKKIYLLWYFSDEMLGLNIAADKLNIPTYEMQHGPHGVLHLAYGSWENVPKRGYEALPNVFQTWDHSSAKDIEVWVEHTEKHSVSVTGNPWVEGWKNGRFKSSNYQWPENIILYTLQPIGNPLEPYLLETIKRTSSKWNWWIRLHPRQGGELGMIKNKLAHFGVLDKVNIKDATKLPLPEILINTSVHLTKFSGSAIEALNFDVPTIILDERGEKTFKDYLETDKMISCTGKNLEEIISRINFLKVKTLAKE